MSAPRKPLAAAATKAAASEITASPAVISRPEAKHGFQECSGWPMTHKATTVVSA